MKIEELPDGLKITAKDRSFFQRVILRHDLPFFFFLVTIFVFLQFFESGNFHNLYLLIIAILIAEIIAGLWAYFENDYYIIWLEIKQNKCYAKYYFQRKINDCDFVIDDMQISIKKRSYLSSVQKVIVFSNLRKKILLEIWPDFAIFGKQWRQDDIYQLYDILIAYQNKLKEKMDE